MAIKSLQQKYGLVKVGKDAPEPLTNYLDVSNEYILYSNLLLESIDLISNLLPILYSDVLPLIT